MDNLRPIIEKWVQKATAFPEMQKQITDGLLAELEAANRSHPDPLHDTEQAMSRGWR